MPKNGIPQAVAAARLLQQLEQKKFEPIPKEWFTLESYMEQNKCGLTKGAKDIKKLVQAGIIEVASWPTLDVRGRALNKQIYRIK